MNPSSRVRALSFLLSLIAATPSLLGASSGTRAASAGTSVSAADDPAALGVPDAALKPFQTELLELAFKAATAIPSFPLIKDRCSLQAAVVNACIELDQPQRAFAYTAKIDNWRRGELYADLAFHLASKHGITPEVQRCLDLAEKV